MEHDLGGLREHGVLPAGADKVDGRIAVDEDAGGGARGVVESSLHVERLDRIVELIRHTDPGRSEAAVCPLSGHTSISG